ncbi:MAG: hypothetical protein R6W76_22925 [Caldilinea sp.]
MTRTPANESADALRQRADALLDEMMIGGVDIGAGFGSDESDDLGRINRFADNGAHQHESDTGHSINLPSSSTQAQSSTFDEAWPSAGQAERPDAAAPVAKPGDTFFVAEAHRGAPKPAPFSENQSDTTAGHPAGALAGELSGRDAWLVPAEDRYARAPVADLSLPVNGPTRSPGSAVRRQSATLASTMTVGARASARSTLLPREVEIDVDTAEQEIHALLSEIVATLPVGHEAAERGRHLLNKAQHILESEPSRTAEVDYYLQQVRRIVQRTRQMHTDSSLYRRRLTLYLTAWVALAVTALAARYMLQPVLLALLEGLPWTNSDSIWVQFGPMAIGAFFAGALGAAGGARFNMQRHAAQEYGYFDRKYGLRGLLLPILGAVFGLLLALLWATICYFVGLDGTDLWIGSLPAGIALVLGFGQERLYGA